MDGHDEIQLMENPDSTEEIPVLDIAPFLAGEPGARERIGAKLREISETVGFFYLIGHRVPQSQIDEIMAETKRLHELPIDFRRTIGRTDRIGYRAAEDREMQSDGLPPPFLSAFVMLRERAPGDPRTVPADPLRMPNHWPDGMPEFREKAVAYWKAAEQAHIDMLPLWDTALGLPDGYLLKHFFSHPYAALSLLHYPPQKFAKTRQYGLKPHTDNGFVTILAQGEVPGLAVRMPSGHWKVAEVMPGAFMVNTGNMMVRITNGRFLSTKHRVMNITDGPRCSVPLFVGADLESMIEVLPTCQGPNNPPQYPPIKYETLYRWYYYGEGGREKSVGPDVKSEGPWLPPAR